jgi:hypothetical protein
MNDIKQIKFITQIIVIIFVLCSSAGLEQKGFRPLLAYHSMMEKSRLVTNYMRSIWEKIRRNSQSLNSTTADMELPEVINNCLSNTNEKLNIDYLFIIN